MLHPNLSPMRKHAQRDNAEAPKGAFAQTKLSWAKPVRAFDELAGVYANPLRELLGGAKLPYAVLTPAYAWTGQPENEKLVLIHNGCFHVWERTRSGVVCASYVLQNIHLLECTNVLLYSAIGIHGAMSAGTLRTSSFRFNAVTRYLFDPFIKEIRGGDGDAPEAEIEKLAYLCKPNLKFMNHAQRALGPGDRVIDALWQPEIRTPRLTFLGRSIFKNIATTHCILLTERELIFLREDETSQRAENGSRYGCISTYVPRDKIIATSVSKTDKSLLALSVQLPGNDSIQSLFLATQQGNLERFLRQIENHR